MILANLDYLEPNEPKKTILGAVNVGSYADTTTLALSNFGYADAVAIAQGEDTKAITETIVKVYEVDKNSSFTYTSADGQAIAHSDKNFSVHDSSSVSIFIYGIE